MHKSQRERIDRIFFWWARCLHASKRNFLGALPACKQAELMGTSLVPCHSSEPLSSIHLAQQRLSLCCVVLLVGTRLQLAGI